MPFGQQDLNLVLASASEKFAGMTFYTRPTVYVIRGRSSSAVDRELGWFVGAFPVDLVENTGLLQASIVWPSRSGSLVPPDAKTGGSYLDFRVAERHRLRSGADVSLLVDPRGNLAEADGCGVLVIDDGHIIAPYVSGHALDSITRRILIELAARNGLAVESRPVHWSQAHGSALLLAGTLSGVKACRLHDSLVDPSPEDLEIAALLRRRYYEFLSDESTEGWLAQPLQL
jgi:branched-chain amino acid aminotransferase